MTVRGLAPALRSSKTPDRFWFLDALPRTETGKLLRRMVPAMFQGRQITP